MTPAVYTVHANDELGRIGSGTRLVVAEVGRKWVRVRTRFASQRIPRKLWRTIPHEPADVEPGRVLEGR